MRIIIDGYNFIFAVPELEQVLDRESMEMAREALLTLLSRHKGASRQEFTVVFDGRAEEGEYPGPAERQVREGINVFFSRGTSADEDIVGIINSSSNPRDMCIVTSDNGIIRAAKASGCRIAKPGEFYEEIAPSSKKKGKPSHTEPTVKYHGPTESEVDYWLKIFKTNWGKDKKP